MSVVRSPSAKRRNDSAKRSRKSGSGGQGDSYRCDTCRHQRDRCETCRAARAAYRRDLRARKRAKGICVDCDSPAKAGEARCERHQEMNAAASAEAHEVARRAAGTRKMPRAVYAKRYG